ncbi:MAG: hypothetical protein EBT81_12080 [Gammaproteobacteria bacterium]|nr:hypothetical protein [Gammaproteobacteria bacterium]
MSLISHVLHTVAGRISHILLVQWFAGWSIQMGRVVRMRKTIHSRGHARSAKHFQLDISIQSVTLGAAAYLGRQRDAGRTSTQSTVGSASSGKEMII